MIFVLIQVWRFKCLNVSSCNISCDAHPRASHVEVVLESGSHSCSACTSGLKIPMVLRSYVSPHTVLCIDCFPVPVPVRIREKDDTKIWSRSHELFSTDDIRSKNYYSFIYFLEELSSPL